MADQNIREKKILFRKTPWKVMLIVGGIVILPFVFKPWVQIGTGEKGIILNLGAIQNKVLGEVIQFKTPVSEAVIPVTVNTQKVLTGGEFSSAHLQDVAMSVALNYHVVSDKFNSIDQANGTAFKKRIINPAIQEVMKTVSAKYTAEELNTKRPTVSSEMIEVLTTRLHTSNIAVDAFWITAFRLSQICTDTIESEQTGEQKQFKAQRLLDKIKVASQQTLAATTAELEELRLQKNECYTLPY